MTEELRWDNPRRPLSIGRNLHRGRVRATTKLYAHGEIAEVHAQSGPAHLVAFR